MQDCEAWAREQWGEAALGDRRRTERAVKVGAALAAAPAASLPAQAGSWGDVKAAYRLLDSAPVTHAAVTAPHRAATRRRAEAQRDGRPVLFIQDTTTLDYSGHAAMSGRGPTGDGRGRGLLAHSCLAVVPPGAGDGERRLLGLAAQEVWARPPVGRKRRESKAERQRREDRESRLWSASLAQSGPAPDGALWISVADAESDVFGHLRAARARGYHCLVRACQDRRVDLPGGAGGHLIQAARALPAQARRTVTVGGRGGAPARAVDLAVGWTLLTIRPPRHNPAQRGAAPLPAWCVRAWGEDLEWILVTTVPVRNAAAAGACLDWYACRWLVEEYHKGLKTGCGIENRQLQSRDRMTALLGFLAVVAVRLLHGRDTARRHPDAPAHGAVPDECIAVLAHYHKQPATGMTQRQFWHGVARLGGFLARRSDGEPGWQTLWKGILRLHDLCFALGMPPPTQVNCG